MIEFAQAAFSYAGADLFTDVTLALSPGSFQFLTGPSGAGKTTLLRLCYGDLLPTSGTVTIFGTDSRTMARDDIARARRRIGVIHQDCNFLDHLSLRENILLPMTVSDRQAEGLAHVDDLLEWVGLRARAQSLPPSLSGGERQRAALARAVITAPDVVIADEPTGNIDWDMSRRLLSLLVELNHMGKAVLIATHDLDLIRAAKPQVSASTLRLRNSRLQAAGAGL